MKRIQTNLEVMSKDEVLHMHETSMRILEEVGMHIPNKELLDMCAARGCKVDAAAQVLRFPRNIMEDFLTVMRRDSKYKVQDEAQKLAGWVSTQVSLVDYHTKERRYGLRDDNLKCIKLIEHLPNIPCASAGVVPSDVPYEIADVVTIADIQKYSTKPGGTYILTPTGAKYVMRINQLLGLQSSYLFEVISPLTFKADTVEMALQFAKNGGGLGIAPMAMSAATAPVTVAGTLALEVAEVLGSCFLVHTMTGEYPGFTASCHSVDPRTTLCSFGAPNQALFALGASQMAKYYGLQGGANTGLTDALLPDFQGGFEKGVTAAFNSLSGLASIGCQGIVGADQGFSFEQLVIDNEWIDYYNYILRGFEVNEETLAFDVIKEVGIGGNFLGEEHTVEHMRENYWPSSIFSRLDWPNWTHGKEQTILDRAHAFVQEKTAGYQNMEPVLAPDVCRELDAIVKDAYAEISK